MFLLEDGNRSILQIDFSEDSFPSLGVPIPFTFEWAAIKVYYTSLTSSFSVKPLTIIHDFTRVLAKRLICKSVDWLQMHFFVLLKPLVVWVQISIPHDTLPRGKIRIPFPPIYIACLSINVYPLSLQVVTKPTKIYITISIDQPPQTFPLPINPAALIHSITVLLPTIALLHSSPRKPLTCIAILGGTMFHGAKVLWWRPSCVMISRMRKAVPG